jgi:FkbM family methyltransferase
MAAPDVVTTQANPDLTIRTFPLELVSYAQFLEDIRLHRALKDVENGFYIDVGANHPLDHSVTKLFYEKGWNGINIEPSPSWFDELVKDRPRDINLKLAASSAAGEAVFHDIAGTGLSTLVDKFAERGAAAGYPGTTIRVETRRLADICDEYVRGDIHFLKVDVEGAEKSVIDGSDFAKYRPWIVLIEATEPMTTTANHFDWEPTLIANGYLFAGYDRVNRYYVSREHSELLPILQIPADQYELRESQLHKEQLVQKNATLVEQLQNQQQTIQSQQQTIQDQQKALQDQQQISNELQKELNDLRGELVAVTNSTSWRVTGPLRAFGTIFKRKK